MTLKGHFGLVLLYFFLISCIGGRKYIIDKFVIETEDEPRDMKLETEIVRMDENTTSSGGQDYSFSHDDCSLRMSCKAPKKTKINAGTCSFTSPRGVKYEVGRNLNR